jgi:succinate dehydrogenase / fumarate reductase, membrane anchor subunit
MSIEIANPRSARKARSNSNVERYSWIFMRISGLVLVFLVLGHLLIMNILDGGVQHGANGMRTVISDYAERDKTRFWLLTLLAVATVFTLVLGTLVIFTFDPNIA